MKATTGAKNGKAKIVSQHFGVKKHHLLQEMYAWCQFSFSSSTFQLQSKVLAV